ncbi:MAG: hypothetical protein K9W44_07665 [Candidatus Lokiarchaeota archaeon]|nr:hypothetical protein [Candidatus Harpocratesius repetitus]
MISFSKSQILIIVIWCLIYTIGLILRLFNLFPLYYLIIVEIYLFIFFLLNIRYALSSHNNFEKKKHSDYFINEILLSISYLALIIYLPFLFSRNLGDELWSFIYFNLWNSLSIHIFCWFIYILCAQRNNQRKHRNLNYSEWLYIVRMLHNSKNDVVHNSTRKLMHFGIAFGLLLIYILSRIFVDIPLFSQFKISESLFINYWWFAISLHLLWMLNIADLFRLNGFSFLGRFATRWFESSIREKEFYTFTSAPLMIISWLPFLLASQPIFIIVAFIGSISDALASIIGKKYGKIKDSHDKTREGYFTGFFSTFILSFLGIMLFIPSINSIWLISFASVLTSIGFYIVDRYAKLISDNFLNSMIVGGILWGFIAFLQNFS